MSEVTQETMKPVQTENRISYLDVLRGVAILFIFTANILFFSAFNFLGEEQRVALPTHSIDAILDMIALVLVDGKFYSIFSILFGIGFVVQQRNLAKHNRPFVPFFRRRMLGLLLIGLIHLFFFWLGDILTLYALLGLVLIFLEIIPIEV